MKHLRAKPLALAIMALAASASLNAQENTSETEVDEVEVASPDSGALEEVYVVGVRAAELKSRELEREVKGFSHIISQDDAGNFADQNVAESLQRIPGITTLSKEGEGNFVTVRGLGPGYVSVSLNGSELASSGGGFDDGEGRGFSLDSIPSDMLGSIEVKKALTPDEDLNSIGGTVNLESISAFDRKKDSVKLKVQGYKQGYDDDYSPKISLTGSNRLLDDTVGVGYSISGEKRNSVTFVNRHHPDIDPRFVSPNDTEGLIPFRYESLQEDAERTRIAGSTTLEYRPNENNHYTVNLSRTEFEDLDIALREYHRWGQAADNEIVYVDPNQRLLGLYGGDVQHQFFIQEGTNTTTAFSFEGEHIFSDGWELDYTLAASDSSYDKPGGSRTQFRLRELPMIGTWGSNYFNSQVVSPAVLAAFAGLDSVPTGGYLAYLPGQALQSNMEYDNLFIEDSYRDDELSQAKLNIRKAFDSGAISYVQFGGTIKARERTRDKDRWSVIPADYSASFCSLSIDPGLCTDWTQGSGAPLGDFATFTAAHPDFQYDFETLEEAERLIAVTAPLALNSDQTKVNIDSRADDYSLQEDSSSIYAMLEWIPFEDASVIAGVKYEKTIFESDGNFTIRNDRDDNFDEGLQTDIVVPFETSKNEYSDILPSIHFRWEPADDLLYRAAVWTSFVRPGYDQTRARGTIADRIEFCIVDPTDYTSLPDQDTGGNFCGEASEFGTAQNGSFTSDLILESNNFYTAPSLALNIGNPSLRAMTSVNFDTSISWYPSEDLYFQAAFFYKDIDNFIADVRSADLTFDEMPVEIPEAELATLAPLQDGLLYTNVNYSVNGEWAKVYGIELSATKNFENGLFVSGNLTLLDSKAKLDDSIRVEELPLPLQAEEISNLTVGWENDKYSVRLSSNYRSESLMQIGSGWSDIYVDNVSTVDFKASWEVNDWLNVYFDALNLTEDLDLEYFSGSDLSGGKILYKSEDFGTSVQFGVNIKLM